MPGSASGNTIGQGKARLRERENLQDRDKAPSALAGLFDELFFGNSLTSSGLRLRRFDITSGTTQALVAYYARTNVVNLCQALASRDADGNSYYRRLLESDLFSLRIGHAYYYRNYLASKFPELCFDTNLGSNFITGASGLFDSLQEYRLNRGLRHLDGYVGTDQLDELSLAIAYQGEQRLDPQQMQYVHALAESQSGFDELGEHLRVHPAGRNPRWNSSSQVSARSTAPRRIATSSSKPTGASSPRSSTGAPICWAPTARVSSTPTYRTKRSAWRSCSTMPPRTATAGYRSLRWRMPNACWCNWAAPTGRKPSAPSTWPARPIGTESCSASKGSPPPPRSCASPPAAVEERPMSAYTRYIRRRALAAADRPAQRSPDASEETRDQPPQQAGERKAPAGNIGQRCGQALGRAETARMSTHPRRSVMKEELETLVTQVKALLTECLQGWLQALSQGDSVDDPASLGQLAVQLSTAYSTPAGRCRRLPRRYRRQRAGPSADGTQQY